MSSQKKFLPELVSLLDYNVYAMDRREKAKYTALAAVALFAAGFMFFNSPVIALIIAIGSFLYPRYRAEELLKKRKSELNYQFKEALYCLSSSLSAGKSLESSFRDALKDLRVLYPEEKTMIVTEFEYICKKMELNEPVEISLLDFASRSGLEDIKNFAEVIFICKRTGGNLVQVVKNTANIITDKIEIAQDLDLLLAKQRYERKILNIMPFVFIALIRFGGSGYMDPLYASPRGYIIMGAAMVIIGLSYVVSAKIFDIRV